VAAVAGSGGGNDQPPLSVEVQNLSRLRSALRAAGPGLVEQVKAANFEVADHVAQSARSLAQGQGGAAAKSAPSIRALKTSTAAKINLGGGRYAFAKGAEFGSFRYKQFKPYRGNQWAGWGNDGVGYFLHPTIRAQREYIIKTYGDRVEAIMAAAFPGGAA
jgi:hypothetical protein